MMLDDKRLRNIGVVLVVFFLTLDHLVLILCCEGMNLFNFSLRL